MKKVLFSIVITTFNNEDFIKKTLDSVVNQTLNNKQYEIIVIDDHSSDSTWNIVQQTNAENLYMYRLSENSGGPSHPRNKGIELSKGDYIYFLDGDDWLEPTILENIAENKQWLKSDVIISKVIKVSDNKKSVHARFMTDQAHINQRTNNIPYLYYYLGPSGKFISLQLIKKNNIRFLPDLHFGEDKLFFLNVFSVAKRATTTTKIGCYINRLSQNVSIIRRTNFIKKRESDFEIFKAALQIKNTKTRDKFLLRIVEYDLLYNCNSHVFNNLNDVEKESVFKIIKEIYYNDYVRKKIVKNINYRFKNAVEAIYENDLEKFVCFFKWLKQGVKLLEQRAHNRYSLTSVDDYHFEYIAPISNLKNLQVSEECVYLQIDIHNLDKERVSSIQLENRKNWRDSKFIQAFTLNQGFLTIVLNKSDLDKLVLGIFNIMVMYDSYKTLNIKYAFTKEVKVTGKIATFYPTINGNLALKVSSDT
ncbi:glycosyltransferase family 2 protein [Staphylococcus cohnii]